MTELAPRVPCTVVTGFLGAGKTTLIRHLLENAGGRRLAILVNEFGEVGIDGEILRGCGIASCPEENIVELANGCICCTVADDFVPALDLILSREPRVDHILIETSGLALPKPLVQAFQWPGVKSRVTVDSVVAVVDGPALAEGRVAQDEDALAAQRAADPSLAHDDPVEEVFGDQVACADLVVLTKGDLLDDGAMERARRRVERHLGRAVKVVAGVHGRVDPAALLGRELAVEDAIDRRRTLHDDEPEHDHDDFESFVVELTEVARPEELAARVAAAAAAADVLRVKGFAAVEGRPMRLLVQAVGPRVSHHYDRAWAAGEPRGTRLVVIGLKGIDRAAVERILGGLMHILNVTTASLDDLIEPVDLGQRPAQIVALSFSDSDLAALAAAWAALADASRPDPGPGSARPAPACPPAGRALPSSHAAGGFPELRLAALRDLRHPMSVDLWAERVAAGARVVLVRLLGGYDWWSYGCDRLAALARARGIALALLPGECREEDRRLAALSTVSPAEQAALLAYFREGGPENMRALLVRLAGLAGLAGGEAPPPARPLPRVGVHMPGGGGVRGLDALAASGRPAVAVLFYRSMLLAGDVAPIDALAAALEAEGLAPVPVFVPSLRDAAVLAELEPTLARLAPAAVVTATAFAAGEAVALFARLGAPVFQVVPATTRREAWAGGARGLAPADLAMHVVLPELDGRILAGAISFKEAGPVDDRLGLGLQVNRPEPDRIAQVARRIAAQVRLASTPVAERRLAILIPDYPAAPGRSGYAVGLDVPASVLAMLADLKAAGYAVEAIPATPRELMRPLASPAPALALADYRALAAGLPAAARAAVAAAWGEPEAEADTGGFGFRAARFGNVTVALAPDRGRSADRRADYHDPALPPRHALLAFGLWLRHGLGCHALVHVGAHGTLEWLPGKTVALSAECFPELVAGALPVVYPFIVSNPGEAAQAKRRIGAVTLGHLTPPLAGAGLGEAERELERLVDEYAQADGLDRRRRERLAGLIVATARETGLAGEAGVGPESDPEAALVRIDAWLCDLKDFAIKDGLHVYGRAAPGDGPERQACAEAERAALVAALDGRFVAPGPAGAPARGRTDVLPTGRNLYAADPRTLPTPTAFALGKAAADETLRRFVQEHGDWPRALVIDLWGSANLRSGGEAIAQGLALMGCRPQWDAATARVTGIEVLPPAAVGRPRVDVTWRISGLFRDMFATQIALIDAAVAAVAAREETAAENPLAAAGLRPRRIFGSAPGTYGGGPEERLASGAWETRAELGEAYLEAGSHAFGGAEGEGLPAAGAFAERVAAAELLVHAHDDPGRDILEGSADVAFVGGFAAAVAALGGKADLVLLDTTDPARPRARSLAEAVTRTVRARALNPRFIAGQLRHGPRGAAELAETVDRLVGFAETTDAVAEALIEAVHAAYVADPAVRAFLLAENPAAARAIAERFAAARRRGLWHPRRNAVDDDLASLMAEARARELAA